MSDQFADMLSSTAPEAVRSLPWSAHAIVAVCLLVGLGLWAAGGKALRVCFAGLGLVVGAGVGYLTPAALQIQAEPMVGAAIGGALGLLLGIALFRFTVALALAGVLAAILPICASALIHQFGSPIAHMDENIGALESSELWLEGVPVVEDWAERELSAPGETGEHDAIHDHASPEAPTNGSPAERTGTARVRAFFAQLADELSPIWKDLPARDRALLILASITGWAVGLALGMVIPKKSAAIVAAGAGAALWLPAALWLAHAAGMSPNAIPNDGLLWLGIWAGLSVLGAGIQWIVGARRSERR